MPPTAQPTLDDPRESRADSDFYSRMLPPKDRPIEALGGVLAGLGAGLGILAIFVTPVFLGVLAMAAAGTALTMARSRQATRRFGILFAIATAGWFIGMCYAVWRSKDLWP